MPDASAINGELQRRLKADGLASVDAVTAARWLDQAGLLHDSVQRPGKPLRDLLRAGRILGQRQESNRWWFVDRVQAGPPAARAAQPPAVPTPISPPTRVRPVAESGEAWYEKLRLEYRPERLKVLLVAESPPDPGNGPRRFFYAPDLSQHDNLYRGVAEALYGAEPGFNVDSKVQVLRRIQADGFWLIDASEQPVNHLSSAEKTRSIRASIPRLVDRCVALAPERGVILCKRVLFDLAATALRAAKVAVLHDTSIPFPLGNHRAQFVADFRRALKHPQRLDPSASESRL
ncbi:MAG: hypothetical protein FD180_147 [Planctomycetota bacterium]|nr:MAG: hypothetical protein FD180_147 [Planctomycetota bacterium]